MFGNKKHKEEIENLKGNLEHLNRENQKLRSDNAELQSIIENNGGGEYFSLSQEIDRRREELIGINKTIERTIQEQRQTIYAAHQADIDSVNQLQYQRDSLSTEIARKKAEIKDLSNEISTSRDVLNLQTFGLYDYKNPAEDSVRLSESLEEVRSEIKQMVKDKKAVTAIINFTFNNSVRKGTTFTNKLSKLALRSYNAEAENAMTRLKAGNLESGKKRLEMARKQVERMGDMIDLKVTQKYHNLRIREMELACAYLEAKKAEKEEERERRARLREEEKAQKEYQREIEKLKKEQGHYENIIHRLEAEGEYEKALEYKNQQEEVLRKIETMDYRSANIRAGYVYVISNVGSFGDNMLKIGMTRRLEPMDRIRELGDASVPFGFDVHALHFSDDAVTVETELHKKFADKKVNLINTRREFFYATPEEVKQALMEVDGSVLEYREEPEAEQFRLSEELRSQM